MKFDLPKTPAVKVTSKSFRLAQVAPDGIAPFAHSPDDKSDASPRLLQLRQRLSELQERLYAEQERNVLLIFQAKDTGGKDTGGEDAGGKDAGRPDARAEGDDDKQA